MPGWEIAVIVIASIVGLYLLCFFLILLLVLEFRKKLKNKYHAINLLLIQKYDILQLLEKLLVDKNYSLPRYYFDIIKDMPRGITMDMSDELKGDFINKVAQAKQALIYFAEMEDKLYKDPEYLAIKKTISEVELNYRRALAGYNSDVSGYNYWVSYPIYFFIFNLLKMTKKDMIS